MLASTTSTAATGIAAAHPPRAGADAASGRFETWQAFIVGFFAGALAVPLFHQSLLLLLVSNGFVVAQPFSATPAAISGVPQILSTTFWGGLWGAALALVLRRVTVERKVWVTAAVFGAILPSLVAWLVVAPIKGLPLLSGGDLKRIATAILINGAWGVGTALLILIWRNRKNVIEDPYDGTLGW